MEPNQKLRIKKHVYYINGQVYKTFYDLERFISTSVNTNEGPILSRHGGTLHSPNESANGYWTELATLDVEEFALLCELIRNHE